MLVLFFRKPEHVILVEEEKTIIIKEGFYSSNIDNAEDIENDGMKYPDNFMALRSTCLPVGGINNNEEYDPTGLTNIADDSET